jgi:hypothetical protein
MKTAQKAAGALEQGLKETRVKDAGEEQEWLSVEEAQQQEWGCL